MLIEELRDLGNTVLVVEHDAETIERADYVIESQLYQKLANEGDARAQASLGRMYDNLAGRD